MWDDHRCRVMLRIASADRSTAVESVFTKSLSRVFVTRAPSIISKYRLQGSVGRSAGLRGLPREPDQRFGRFEVMMAPARGNARSLGQRSRNAEGLPPLGRGSHVDGSVRWALWRTERAITVSNGIAAMNFLRRSAPNTIPDCPENRLVRLQFWIRTAFSKRWQAKAPIDYNGLISFHLFW